MIGKRSRRAAEAVLILGVLPLLGCSDVNNADNYAIVSGRVLNSVADPTGVEGVVVWVESDPSSDVAYLGGDISATTDANGEYEARVHLGYLTVRDRPDEETGNGTFDPMFPRFVGDARLLMIYQDTGLDLGGGFTLERGQTIHVWDVYLTEFAPLSGDSAGVSNGPPGAR